MDISSNLRIGPFEVFFPVQPATPTHQHTRATRCIPGRLFIVEGIDGSAKSTQLLLLHKWLESRATASCSRVEFLAIW